MIQYQDVIYVFPILYVNNVSLDFTKILCLKNAFLVRQLIFAGFVLQIMYVIYVLKDTIYKMVHVKNVNWLFQVVLDVIDLVFVSLVLGIISLLMENALKFKWMSLWSLLILILDFFVSIKMKLF